VPSVLYNWFCSIFIEINTGIENTTIIEKMDYKNGLVIKNLQFILKH